MLKRALWHPVLLSGQVRRRPRLLTLAGTDYAVFRTAGGEVGILENRCPHRGMALARGRVEGEELVCPYHGWRFCTSGQGRSLASRRLRPVARHLEARERDGVVWVASPGTPGGPPSLQRESFCVVHRVSREVEAPYELVLDNFTEVEHTAVAHWKFGYDFAALGEVECRTRAFGDRTVVESVGPQKPLPWAFERVLGIRGGDRFIVRWTIRYNPVCAEFDWWWEAPDGTPRGLAFKEIAYFIDVGPSRSRLLSYFLWNRRARGAFGLNRVVAAAMRLAVAYEVGIDVWLVENIVPEALRLENFRLGRFDRALVHHRRQLGNDAGCRPTGLPDPRRAAWKAARREVLH